jgi:DNA-binding transcriptional LysR family regulator
MRKTKLGHDLASAIDDDSVMVMLRPVQCARVPELAKDDSKGMVDFRWRVREGVCAASALASVKEADGAASALAFVAAGFGVAVVSEPLQKIPAKDVIFRDLAPEESAWVPVGAAWKPNGVSAPVVSQFVDVLAQACAGGNGGSRIPAIGRSN